MTSQDLTEQLGSAVNEAIDSRSPLVICGSGSKSFYGEKYIGQRLDVAAHQGVLNYEPSELVITARAGTPLKAIEKCLDEHNQQLPFEPPHFAETATLGGTIACGFSGPRRPWAGAARDLVLGIRTINGRGEILRFGGEVMKNVAGYDVSRLMTGALGTLSVILDVSLKVLPKPEREITLVFQMDAQSAIDKLCALGRTPCPLSAAAQHQEQLFLRLSGSLAGVTAAQKTLGGEQLGDNTFWHDLREHSLPFFNNDKQNLWRLSLPPATPVIKELGQQLIDWGGAQRWLFSAADETCLRQTTAQQGGHASCFRRGHNSRIVNVFHPMAPGLQRLNTQVKAAFDPLGIFNIAAIKNRGKTENRETTENREAL